MIGSEFGWLHISSYRYRFVRLNRRFNLRKNDSIGLFSYNIDTHNAQRFGQGEYVRNEGDVEMFGSLGRGQMPYRSVIPRAAEATNLIVPVAMSATHLGYGTIRLEPQFMILGQSTGIAAAQAIADAVTFQALNVTKLQARLRQYEQKIDM
jgi:hypothetical protein